MLARARRGGRSMSCFTRVTDLHRLHQSPASSGLWGGCAGGRGGRSDGVGPVKRSIAGSLALVLLLSLCEVLYMPTECSIEWCEERRGMLGVGSAAHDGTLPAPGGVVGPIGVDWGSWRVLGPGQGCGPRHHLHRTCSAPEKLTIVARCPL